MTHTLTMRIMETVLYTLVNSLPYHFCTLYCFRKSLRFSWPVTIAALLPSTVLELGLYLSVLLGHAESSSFISIAWALGYVLTYLILIKEPPGKVVFLILVLMNVSNFNIVASKCMEYYIFFEHAWERYHLSNSLTMMITELMILAPFFISLHRRFIPALRRPGNLFMWRYLWLIPATFYYLWIYHIHFGSSSSLEVATDIHAIVFLFITNCGSYLIYYIVLRLINESANNAELRIHNHQLALQTLQYESLQERIQETRKANHDLRHHVTTMNALVEQQDYDALHRYFSSLIRSLPSAKPLHYCQHNTLNMLLTYFSQMAEEANVDYRVDLQLPENLPLADSDLTVLLGNLLENAVEAAAQQTTPDRKVLFRARAEGGHLLFALDNSYSTPVKKDSTGVFLSTKHPGSGIGVESAKSIVHRLGGQITIQQQAGMFYVSILLPIA